MVLRTRNALLLAEIEGSEGVAETPAAANDAVLAENLQFRETHTVITTNEHRASLDQSPDIIGGTPVEITFDVVLKGSGAAATAPEIGKLLRACGMSQVITSTAVPAAPEACGAGGNTTTAELGASASTTAQIYRGMPITFSTGVSGTTFITDYTTGKIATLAETMGGTIDAGTNYQIPVNVLYTPASASIPSLTFNTFHDGLKKVARGCRGDFSLSFSAGGVARISFRFLGIFVSVGDAALPSDAVFDATSKPIYKNGILKINRVAAAASTFTIAMNNEIIMPPDPNESEGMAAAIITGRKITGTLDLNATLVATRDLLTDIRAGTNRILHTRYGATAGNRIGFTAAEMLPLDNNHGDRSGVLTEQVSFQLPAEDAAFGLCFY